MKFQSYQLLEWEDVILRPTDLQGSRYVVDIIIQITILNGDDYENMVIIVI